MSKSNPDNAIFMSDQEEEIKKKIAFKGKIYTVDATKISIDTVGKNLPNTPMLGALIKLSPFIKIDAIKNCIKSKFQKKLGEEKTNATIRGVDLAYAQVK